MVWLTTSDYHKENKKSRRSNKVMKKIKLPTQMKTKSCSHSLCPFPSIITIKLGVETRNLCKKHLEEYKNKNEKNPVVITRASSLL